MSPILKPQKCSAESLEYCWSVLGPLDGQNPRVWGAVQQAAPPGVSYAWVWNPAFWWRSAEAELPGLKIFLWLEWSRLGLQAFSQNVVKQLLRTHPQRYFFFFFHITHLEKPKALWMWQIHRFLHSDEDEERKLVPGPGRRSQNRNINATTGPGEICSRSPGSISRQPH